MATPERHCKGMGMNELNAGAAGIRMYITVTGR
jgi:hypothetical protein